MLIDASQVTIIIPHLGQEKNQEDSLATCVTSLQRTIPDVRRIIVKNGGQKEGSHFPIVLEEQGQSKAVNAAIATVRTPWLFVTNDDMIFANGWWERLTGNITDQLCISPVLVEPIDGAPSFIKQLFGRCETFDQAKWEEYASHYEGGTWETGFNLPFLIRSDVWHTIGGYDVSYDPFGSNGDSDLQAKIHLAGVQTWRNRSAIVYHFSQTSGTSRPENHSYWEQNWKYFTDKWGFNRQSSPAVWYSQNLIDYSRLKFHPDWMGKYGQPK